MQAEQLTMGMGSRPKIQEYIFAITEQNAQHPSGDKYPSFVFSFSRSFH